MLANLPPTSTGSHPAIEFKNVPVTPGQLFRLEHLRPQILQDVVQRTKEEFLGGDLELSLSEMLYLEKARVKRERGNWFTRRREHRDQKLIRNLQHELIKSPSESDRGQLLEDMVRYYAEEIGGHFDPRVYQMAVHAVPWGFSWFLNAASVRRFLPWGMTEALASRIKILGEVPAVQRLVKKGTILLVPTHQSNIDSVLIGYIIYLMGLPPFAYGAGLNLFSNPVLNFFMSRLGSYTVDRKKTNLIYKSTLKNYSSRILKEGIHSIFFPGGGRSRTGAIESKVKLGLLGTGLDAELEGLRAGRTESRVYVVPMVISYHFVLEASSLIENYLEESGRHRYLILNDESWQPTKIFGFFWKMFSSQTSVTVRIGKPLDVFGNFVDEEGVSIGPNGTSIDHLRWLTTRGELRCDPQRDQEYTRELGARLVDRFHKENTVLTSHLVAFILFEILRSKYPEFDLFRFLRITKAQRSVPFSEFLSRAEDFHQRLIQKSDRGELYVSDELRTSDTREWVKEGAKQLGLLHDLAVVRIDEEVIWTEDMNLLYYYRNRLSGYGLSVQSELNPGLGSSVKLYDAKGFLA